MFFGMGFYFFNLFKRESETASDSILYPAYHNSTLSSTDKDGLWLAGQWMNTLTLFCICWEVNTS